MLFLLLPIDKFKKNQYPTLDVASILKASSTVGPKALKPSFSSDKHVRGKLDCLSKESTGKDADEALSGPKRAKLTKARSGRGAAKDKEAVVQQLQLWQVRNYI